MSDSERDHMESYNRVRNGAPPTTGPFYIHPGAPNGSQYRNGHPVTPVTPAMTPLVGPYTRFAPYRQQSTQVLLDRDRKITLAKEEAAATKMRAQTTPQMFVRRAVLSGLPVSRTPPTLKDMIVHAFNNLKPKCPRGIRFPRLLQEIRETFPISTTMNISLEYHVDKALNDMMRKGVVSQAYGSLPMRGIYFLLQDETSRTKSISFQGRNGTGDHSGVREFNVKPVNGAPRNFLEREVISKTQAKALDVGFQKIQIDTTSGVNAKPGFHRTLNLDSTDSMISLKVVPRQTNSKLAELRSNERTENSVTPPDDVHGMTEKYRHILRLCSASEEMDLSDIAQCCSRRNESFLTKIRATFSFFGRKVCKVTPL